MLKKVLRVVDTKWSLKVLSFEWLFVSDCALGSIYLSTVIHVHLNVYIHMICKVQLAVLY